MIRLTPELFHTMIMHARKSKRKPRRCAYCDEVITNPHNIKYCNREHMWTHKRWLWRREPNDR